MVILKHDRRGVVITVGVVIVIIVSGIRDRKEKTGCVVCISIVVIGIYWMMSIMMR